MKRILSSLALLAGLATTRAADYPQPTGATMARTFPYSMIGQLLFTNGPSDFSGSGTIIRPNSVLTAAHNLWDADSGFSTDLLFRRSLYGATDLSEQFASRIYVLAGYRENARRYDAEDLRAFSYDMGALLFARPVAGGSFAGWWANPALLTGGYTIALGYGAEKHSGDDLLSVAPATGYVATFGGFYENGGLYFESGMSGGPVFGRDPEGRLYVAGVVVASSLDPVAGGIRILNSTAATFIRRYMK